MTIFVYANFCNVIIYGLFSLFNYAPPHFSSSFSLSWCLLYTLYCILFLFCCFLFPKRIVYSSERDTICESIVMMMCIFVYLCFVYPSYLCTDQQWIILFKIELPFVYFCYIPYEFLQTSESVNYGLWVKINSGII